MNQFIRYKFLLNFDRDMNALEAKYQWLTSPQVKSLAILVIITFNFEGLCNPKARRRQNNNIRKSWAIFCLQFSSRKELF
jgi:hypothetical protein